MIPIHNYVTKILSNDAKSSFSILTYLDIEKELTPEYVLNYATAIVDDNPILKHDIVKNGNRFFLKKNSNFNIDNHITIKYTETDPFDAPDSIDSIDSILNSPLVPNTFSLTCCINPLKKATRIYFKINHAYTDGYGLINMLTKPILKRDNLPDFKRKPSSLFKTIYHYVIGTLVLFVMNLKIFFKIFASMFEERQRHPRNPVTHSSNANATDDATDFIICKPFMLDQIKKMAARNGITVNDFLYSLMIKTDKLYTKQNRTIQTCSPINVSSLTSTNNVSPILNRINNSLGNRELMKQVNSTFNHFKYSLFIPLFSCLINAFVPHINFDTISGLYEALIYNCDYIYSNIIGPPIKEVNRHNINVSNIHFLTKAKGDAIIFNIISCENKINIICSFQTGKIQNKKRFERCIYRAYDSLMHHRRRRRPARTE